jgi:hypothetical protein
MVCLTERHDNFHEGVCNVGRKEERVERGYHALWSKLESAEDAICDLHTIGDSLDMI